MLAKDRLTMRRNSPFTRQFTQLVTRYSHPGRQQTGRRRTKWAAIALLAALTTACGGTSDTAEPLNNDSAAERPAPESDVATDSESNPATAAPKADATAEPSNTATAQRPIALPPELPPPDICNDQQTQADMTACSAETYEQVEQQQRTTYRTLFNLMTETEQTYLIESEGDWVLFRDAHCEFAASWYEGGSIQPMVLYDCLASVTRDRSVALARPIGSASYSAADDALNRTYQTLKNQLDEADQDKLIDVQLLWLDYRDSTCGQDITPRIGTDGSINQCLALVTEQRTAELEAQIERQQL
jgi:uncharacterized protein YecT (DUF1311 family)